MCVLFENWPYLVKERRKNSIKKMEIIYCNYCLNLTLPPPLLLKLEAFTSNPRKKKKLHLLYYSEKFQ